MIEQVSKEDAIRRRSVRQHYDRVHGWNKGREGEETQRVTSRRVPPNSISPRERYTDIYLLPIKEAVTRINLREYGLESHSLGWTEDTLKTWIAGKLRSYSKLKRVDTIAPHEDFVTVVKDLEKRATTRESMPINTQDIGVPEEVLRKDLHIVYAALSGMSNAQQVVQREPTAAKAFIWIRARDKAKNEGAQDIEARAKEIVAEWFEKAKQTHR